MASVQQTSSRVSRTGCQQDFAWNIPNWFLTIYIYIYIVEWIVVSFKGCLGQKHGPPWMLRNEGGRIIPGMQKTLVSGLQQVERHIWVHQVVFTCFCPKRISKSRPNLWKNRGTSCPQWSSSSPCESLVICNHLPSRQLDCNVKKSPGDKCWSDSQVGLRLGYYQSAGLPCLCCFPCFGFLGHSRCGLRQLAFKSPKHRT